jgi:putative hydroxymethylpyrimidine transport system permease protein
VNKSPRAQNLPALILLFLLLTFWQLGAMGMDAAYILPSPVQILARLWQLRVPLLTVHLPATMLVVGLGLLFSVLLGLLLAAAMDLSPLIQKALYPLIVASQTVPTTAIAPLFVLWFGYGVWSKVLVVLLITFFPITITVYDGLRAAGGGMERLLITYGAGKGDILLKLKLPCALPYFFSALKMAIPMSVIGAAIGEWLGAQSGLGYFSRRMMTQLDGAGVFAPILLLALAAMLAVALVGALERRIVRWRGR